MTASEGASRGGQIKEKGLMAVDNSVVIQGHLRGLNGNGKKYSKD